MKKLIRILGKIIVVAFALLVAGAIAITVFFDPNDYKDDIAAYVKDQTGRELAMKGELSLSLFPWVGLEIGETELGNAPGFGDQPFARVEEVGLKVKLLPLLRRRVIMDTVILEGLELNLVRNAQGRGNWEGLAGPEKPKPEAKAPAKREPREAVRALDISGVRVSGARIEWHDRQAVQRVALSDLALRTGRLGIGEPVDVELTFDVQAAPEARPRHVVLSARVALDAALQNLDVRDLVLEAAGLELAGELTGRGLQAEPRFEGSLQLAEFVPRRLLQELELEVPPTADATVFGKAALRTRVQATPSSVELTELSLRLDDTELSGRLAIQGFQPPAYRFDLNVDQVDVDRYLPPAPAEPSRAAGAAKPAPPGEAAPLIPVELLRSLNVEGTLRIGKLKAYNIRSEQIEITVTAKKGSLRVHPASARLYGGRYAGDVRVDARGKRPVVSMDEKLSGIQAEPLFRDAAGWDWLSGTADLSAQLSGTGAEAEAIKRTLRGAITFSFADGVVNGVNIPHLIRTANAALRGEAKPPGAPQRTDFTSLSGSAQVKNGVVDNRDLQVKSPLLRIEGSGTADLVRERLDYLVKAVIVGSLEGQSGAALAQLKGVPIPVRITGPFASPDYRVELEKVITETQKKRVEEEVEEQKEELEKRLRDKLKEGVGDKLKGLFK